jgi:hypothetical protein
MARKECVNEGGGMQVESSLLEEEGGPDPFRPAMDNQRGSSLKPLSLNDIPKDHPVRLFAKVYAQHISGALIPHEDDIIHSEEAFALLSWARQIEPIELEGGVDFKVLRQGERAATRERRTYHDQWMSATVDHEFVQAHYREVMAAAVLRRPRFSKGNTPTRARAFLYLLRGIFPVFAENHARFRIFQVEAEPYVSITLPTQENAWDSGATVRGAPSE